MAIKKVLITHDLHAVLAESGTFLDRSGMTVFTASTNDEALKLHRSERVNLIITELDLPGMSSEQLCSLIRDDADLRTVSMIMVCANAPEAIERSRHCRANAVLLQPVHPMVLMVKAQQLLAIAARESLRVLLSATIANQSGDEPFSARTQNISVSGMLIVTDKRLVEGSRLSCAFNLPNARKIQVAGKVTRIEEESAGDEEFHYGLMFTDITSEAKQLLIAYVEDSLGRSHPSDA